MEIMKMNRTVITIMVFAFLAIGIGSQVSAASSKDRLIGMIGNEQKSMEKKIIQMWMKNERGKEFEIILADYVSREVRYRAMSGNADNGTLLATINSENRDIMSNPTELGRLIILEYFKRKGVDLKNKCFVKGNYMIGLRSDFTESEVASK